MRTEKGLVLEGRYELTDLIATGGMGQVWRGRDRDLDRDVAVKVLREEYAGDEGFLKRFRAEARHTAALSHDAIAALYDYGELDGRAYIVMELCEGRPLSDIIEENTGGLPERLVISMLIELARALDAAHSKGVVHRDVKPENILVDEDRDWHLKITDFGIARSTDQARLTRTGLVMGTAQYLSPEQAVGKQATSLSDVYALGIVAFEMLTGHRPFTGASQVDIAMAQVKQSAPELPGTVDPDLRQLVAMTLSKAPANRPRSAAAVARILEAIQRGEHPRFTTGAVASTSRAADDPPGSPAEGAQASPSGAPSTRTAAMPLPRTSARRGIRHRSGSSATSGPSALTAASGSSANPGTSRTGSAVVASPPAGAAARSGAWRPADAPGPAADARTGDGAGPRALGTSTGRRIGPFSVPGLLLLLLLLAVAAVAILGGTGMLGDLGALGGPGASDVAVGLAGAGAEESTMSGWADDGPVSVVRTVGL